MKKIFLVLFSLVSIFSSSQTDVTICQLPETTTGTIHDLIIKEDSNCNDPNGTKYITVENFIKTYSLTANTGYNTPLFFVNAATTASLSATYSTGTLTATSNGRIANIDGVVIDTSSHILNKNSTNKLYNGIYSVTDTGTASTPYILVRDTLYDSSSEIYPSQVNVLAGTVNSGNYYLQITVNPTVGVDSIDYITTPPPIPYVPYSGAIQRVNLNNKSLVNVDTLTSNNDATIHGIRFGQGASLSVQNVVAGNNSMILPMGAGGNSVFGAFSLYQCSGGGDNSIFGYQNLNNLTSGNDNTVLGARNGTAVISGSNNLYIGTYIDPPGSESNKLRIGTILGSSNLLYGDFSAKTLTINGATTTTLSNSYANTPTANSNDTKVATTAYVDGAVNTKTITLTGDVTGSGTGTISTTAAGTIVKTVILNTPGVIFDTPVTYTTTTGTATGSLSLVAQSPNTFLAGASSGTATATPTMRAIVTGDLPANTTKGAIAFNINDGGGIVATGAKRYVIAIPYECTITGYVLFSTSAGVALNSNTVLDVWKTTSGSLPTVANTIFSGNNPTLSASSYAINTSMSVAVAAGDVIIVAVTSNSAATNLNLILNLTKN